jgi:hypothetical protein
MYAHPFVRMYACTQLTVTVTKIGFLVARTFGLHGDQWKLSWTLTVKPSFAGPQSASLGLADSQPKSKPRNVRQKRPGLGHLETIQFQAQSSTVTIMMIPHTATPASLKRFVGWFYGKR